MAIDPEIPGNNVANPPPNPNVGCNKDVPNLKSVRESSRIFFTILQNFRLSFAEKKGHICSSTHLYLNVDSQTFKKR
jgi:hypothetical protein